MITEGESARKLSRLQECCGGDDGSSAASPPPNGEYANGGQDSNDSSTSIVVSDPPSTAGGAVERMTTAEAARNGLRPMISMEEDSNSEISMSRATTPAGSLIWQHERGMDTEDGLQSLPNSIDLTTHLQRKEVFNARKQREFIPDNKKDESYWDRRRRNNEAAKRSREKRRLNDMVLETRVIELTKENAFLRAQLTAIREKFGIVGENLVAAEQVALPPADHQMALNLTKRAKLLTPLMGSGSQAAVAMLTSSGQSQAAALRSLVVQASTFQQQQQQNIRSGALGLSGSGKTYLGAGGGGTNNDGRGARMLMTSHGGAAVSDVTNPASCNEYWALRDENHVYLHANSGNPVPRQQHHHLQNGHHEHQGALLSALNGTSNNHHQENGYAPRSAPAQYGGSGGRLSPLPPSNGYHHAVPLALITTNEYQQRALVAHQAHFRNGYALPMERQREVRLSAGSRDSRNGDDCCSSSGSSSCDEAAGGRCPRSPASPVEAVDVEGYGPTAAGGALVDPQMHLPHKLRHKPRLSECSAPALSPPSLGTVSPPVALNGHAEVVANGHHDYPEESSASGDERENHPAMDSSDAGGGSRRRKRKTTIYGDPPNGVALQQLRTTSDHLETENTQLKMEMHRLAVEVASLKDMLICKKDGSVVNGGSGGATCRSSRSEAGAGFATDWGRESESGCA